MNKFHCLLPQHCLEDVRYGTRDAEVHVPYLAKVKWHLRHVMTPLDESKNLSLHGAHFSSVKNISVKHHL